MALIDCNLCKNKISSRAKFCPKCGCPNIYREDASGRKVRDCSTCSYAPTEPGLTCNLCDIKPVEPARRDERLPLGAPGFPGSSEADDRHASIKGKIEALEIGKDLKEIFNLIAVSERESGPLSEMPEEEDHRLKCFRSLDSRQSICSNLALFLGPAYYFIHGIWKKAVLLSLIMLSSLLFLIVSGTAAKVAFILLVIGINLTCYCKAKRDRYRMLVLEESFWW